MAISLERSGSNSVNGGTSLVANFGTAPTEGNLLVATATAGTTMSSQPSGWTVAVQDASPRVFLCWKIAGASEPTTATWTLSSGNQGLVTWSEYSSTTDWLANPVDVTAASGTGTGTSCSSGTTAPTTQGEALAIAAYRIYGGSDLLGTSLSNSFTMRVEADVELPQSWSLQLFQADKILSSTGQQESTLSWTTPSASHRGVIAVFLPDSTTITTSGTLNAGGSIAAATIDHQNQIARPTSTTDAGDWDTGPTTGQDLHTYAGDNSDATYIQDSTA